MSDRLHSRLDDHRDDRLDDQREDRLDDQRDGHRDDYRHGRRSAALLAAAVLVALAFLPAPADRRPAPAAGDAGSVTLLGDGSTSDTGPQPGQRPVARLKAGERPPQFVVFSIDDADGAVISELRPVARQNSAQVTFFVRGTDLLPAAKRSQYQPPQHPVGTAAVPPPTDAQVRATLLQLGQAWLDGHEIAGGFVGQFCGAKGARDWSTTEWESEIDQGNSLVNFWKTGTGFTDLPPLPFDYQTELVGGRAPCLEGRPALLPAEQDYGWRYDASSSGGEQRWPVRTGGLWDFPLQRIPGPSGRPVLASDQSQETYLAAFEHAYAGDRAPLIIGAHPSGLPAVESTMAEVCHRADVRCVSFRELADWLDAQDPAVLARLGGSG